MSRFPVFVTGLLVGAGISAIAVYVVYNSSYRGNVKTTIREQIVTPEQPLTSYKEEQPIEETDQTDASESAFVSQSYVQTEEKDFYPNIDNNSALYDSLKAAHLEEKTAFELVENNEVVRKEKMLGLAKIKLISKLKDKPKSKVDSLLEESNNVRTDELAETYDVEFWQTPLNSKGYRMGKNKIALYGIDPASSLVLFQLEEGLFLRNGDIVYRLESSPEFRNLKPVSNASIIKQTTF